MAILRGSPLRQRQPPPALGTTVRSRNATPQEETWLPTPGPLFDYGPTSPAFGWSRRGKVANWCWASALYRRRVHGTTDDVFTLRCTAKVLTRLKVSPAAVPLEPSTRLGDWYANLLFTRPAHLVLCVSERTLLPVLVPARELETLPSRLRRLACEALEAIGVPDHAVHLEESAMADVAIGRTASRRVLGSMNDFAWMADGYLDGRTSLLDVSLRLAETPCGPLEMNSPRRATLALFSASGA